MDANSCPECQAIVDEMRAAAREVRAGHPGKAMTPMELVSWLERLDEEECARLRESSPFWRTWRKLMEHGALTGHSLSFLSALSPGANTSPN